MIECVILTTFFGKVLITTTATIFMSIKAHLPAFLAFLENL
jgi:hypothetical protein